MPNYEYYCKKCVFTWERMKTLAEREQEPTDKCPKCGDDCPQTLNPVGLKFKGNWAGTTGEF